MIQARSGRYYAAEDFQQKRPIPWMALLGSVVLAAIFCGATFLLGVRDGYARGRALERRLAEEAPKRAFSCKDVLKQCADELPPRFRK